ncbi:MAG: hypothetical protein ACK5RJ_04575 [Burkholderiales bacterium]|jgi:hypothetical protein|nr:hypothetical protein [Rhodocyclaceae bacterium]MCA3053600.1 hypothetical protein [Rhodocyclaceae bacterium]
MRFTWSKPNADANATNLATAQSQATSLRLAGPRFVAQDFVKLVAYAVASGIAFSALAIGVTLAVSRDSEAQTSAARWVAQDGMFVLAEDVPVSTVDEAMAVWTYDVVPFEMKSDLSPTPGSLYIGDGCGAEELAAIEREWYVSIDNGIATVQVMQTFVMPEQRDRMVLSASEAPLADEIHETDSSAPTFGALLPSGAEYLDMKIDVSSGRVHGKTGALNGDDEQDYQSVMRTMREAQARGELPVYLNQVNQAGGASLISTAQVLDIRAGETVVVTYRYRIAIAQDNGRSQLTLPLQGLSEADHDPGSGMDFAADFAKGAANGTTNPAATGTVWVEWKNPKAAPHVFDVLPRGASVEQGHSGVAGLNWATPQITPGERFVLGWR